MFINLTGISYEGFPTRNSRKRSFPKRRWQETFWRDPALSFAPLLTAVLAPTVLDNMCRL
jgi:hypothetical protein